MTAWAILLDTNCGKVDKRKRQIAYGRQAVLAFEALLEARGERGKTVELRASRTLNWDNL